MRLGVPTRETRGCPLLCRVRDGTVSAVPGHKPCPREVGLSPYDLAALVTSATAQEGGEKSGRVGVPEAGPRPGADGADGPAAESATRPTGLLGADSPRPKRAQAASSSPKTVRAAATYPRCLHLLRALGLISLKRKGNPGVTDTPTEPRAARRLPRTGFCGFRSRTAASSAPAPSREEGTLRADGLYPIRQPSLSPGKSLP